MSILITLSSSEISQAREVAIERVNTAKGKPRFAYENRDAFDTHHLGAMAEIAVANVFGIKWPARVGTYRDKPDIDPFWEVRWSRNADKVKVAVDDPPHALVAHVTGNAPKFSVHGYVLAGWVQQSVPATDPGNRGRKAHFVSATLITPFDPGFHEVCGWINDGVGWMCLYCGRR